MRRRSRSRAGYGGGSGAISIWIFVRHVHGAGVGVGGQDGVEYLQVGCVAVQADLVAQLESVLLKKEMHHKNVIIKQN